MELPEEERDDYLAEEYLRQKTVQSMIKSMNELIKKKTPIDMGGYVMLTLESL